MIVAIIQARTGSSRLPEKVLKPLVGKPMLERQIERIQRSTSIDKIVIATTKDSGDDSIDELAKSLGIHCFRGSEDDVLDRFYQTSLRHEADTYIRITGDCPVIDPSVIDDMVSFYQDKNLDFLTNTIDPTFPDGQDLWIFKKDLLHHAWKNATKLSDREHVTTFMINNADSVTSANYKAKSDHSNLRWTVDCPEDFQLVEEIYNNLYEQNPSFGIDEILKLMESKPELKELNIKYKRDEGLEKSLQNERADMQNNIEKSLEIHKLSKQLIAAENHLLSKRADQFSDGVWPTYFSKAKEAFVWDLDGNKYVDMSIGGIGATVLGYADEDIDNKVIESIKSGVSSSLNSPEEVELAKLLTDLHPWADKVRYTRSGGEAMTVAIRLARAFTKKDKIAFCGYHGWHDWYLASNLSNDSLKEHLLPGLNPTGVPQSLINTSIPFRFNDVEDFEKVIKENKDDLACIVMEPIRNDAPKEGYLEMIRKVASDNGIVLIFDEISAGFRLTNGGSHKIFNVDPDIAVFSKAIGNGYAISTIIGKEDVMSQAQISFISSTNWTERVGPTAAIATIKKFIDNDVYKHLNEMGKLVQEGWKEAAQEAGIDITIGGIYPLSNFRFHENHLVLKAYYVQEMLQKGFLASNIFYAMYAHKEWHVKKYIEAAKEVFLQIKEIGIENIESKLHGKPAAAGFKRLN